MKDWINFPCARWSQLFSRSSFRELTNICSSFLFYLYQMGIESWQQEQPVVLRTWTAESPHNYDNNCHDVTVFLCPGATSFDVEFDERCETERRQVDQSCINTFWLTFPFGLMSCVLEATTKEMVFRLYMFDQF